MGGVADERGLLVLPILLTVIALSFALALLVHRRRSGGDSLETGLGPPPTINTAQMCPACRNPMRSGYAMSPRGLYWTDRDASGGFLGSIWNLAMSNTVNMGFRTKGNRAWRCPSCRLILIDHSALRGVSRTK